MALPPPGRPLIDLLRDSEQFWLLKEVEEWLHPRKVEEVKAYEFISKYPEDGFTLTVGFVDLADNEHLLPTAQNTRTFYPPQLAQ